MASSSQSVGAIRNGDFSQVLRLGFRSFVGLPVLLALALGTLPARALPAVSVQLFRIDGNGVKPMPGIADALDRTQLQNNAVPQSPQAAPSEVMLAAPTRTGPVGSLSSYNQTFAGPLPRNIAGNLRIVAIDPNTGTVIEPRDSAMLQSPSVTSAGQPLANLNHLASTPSQVTATAVPAVAPVDPIPVVAAAASAEAPARISPLLIIGAVLLVGLGVAAAVGAFRRDSGGGTNTSSQ
jgi:hypothetical protein